MRQEDPPTGRDEFGPQGKKHCEEEEEHESGAGGMSAHQTKGNGPDKTASGRVPEAESKHEKKAQTVTELNPDPALIV